MTTAGTKTRGAVEPARVEIDPRPDDAKGITSTIPSHQTEAEVTEHPIGNPVACIECSRPG